MTGGYGNCGALAPNHLLQTSIGGFAIYREANVNLIMTKSLEHFVDCHLGDPNLGTRLFLSAAGKQLRKPRLSKAIGKANTQPSAEALRGGVDA
ncbi:hypothetical protein Q067_02279 [Pseudomonas aeruginosa BL13]|nr:hypothetical protein Q067_02279 [Pseudomonas aeruginosa BL13]